MRKKSLGEDNYNYQRRSSESVSLCVMDSAVMTSVIDKNKHTDSRSKNKFKAYNTNRKEVGITTICTVE